MGIYRFFTRLVQRKNMSIPGLMFLTLVMALNFVLSFFILPLIGKSALILNLPFLWAISLSFNFLFSAIAYVAAYLLNSFLILFKYQLSTGIEVALHGFAYLSSLLIMQFLRSIITKSNQRNDSHLEQLMANMATKKRLAESEARFRILFENSPVGIALMEPQKTGDWYILDCNTQYAKMNGYEKKELLGKSIDYLHSELVPLERRKEFSLKLDTTRVYTGEYKHKTKSGKIITIEYKLTMVRLNGRNLIIGMDNDISERISMSNQLKEMNEILEQKVSERTRELKEALEVQTKTVNERDVLMQEIHHRVKNNLQLVQSLLTLQMDNSEDEKISDILLDSRNRILSMAMVHERMYQSNSITDLDLHDYVYDLVLSVFNSNNAEKRGIKYDLDIDNVILIIDQIIPVGLIITEIITNSMKHAFNDRDSGLITINLHENAGSIKLEISDNGCGTKSKGKKEKETLGFLLIESLVHQLQGTFERKINSGLKYTIVFKKI